MLLWASEDPAIPSGTVLPVYIKSNLNKTWVAGIPEHYRSASSSLDKFEVPLPKLELIGSRNSANKRADEFAAVAMTYAETLQDGLPVRQAADNVARRVYRLKNGEIIKILSKAAGQPAISASGEALPGEWYEVMTENGSIGYCFSYRLRLFEYKGGSLSIAKGNENDDDADLDRLLQQTWLPESYGAMVNSRRIDVAELSKHWEFNPGIDTGIAHIYTAEVDKSFAYTSIKAENGRNWSFEGTRLRMSLRSDTTLAVQYYDEGDALKTLFFVAIASDVNDLIAQELSRRDTRFSTLYSAGPVFSSSNYGRLILSENGHFTWTGYTLLVPQVISVLALGGGTINTGVFLGSAVSSLYNGALAFQFEETSGRNKPVYFMYTLDSQGLRIEYVPPENVDGATIMRRAYSPTVIYFVKSEMPGLELPSVDEPRSERPSLRMPDIRMPDMPSLDLPAIEYTPSVEPFSDAPPDTWSPSVELSPTPLPQDKEPDREAQPIFNMDY
jgi:hypothetical protein